MPLGVSEIPILVLVFGKYSSSKKVFTNLNWGVTLVVIATLAAINTESFWVDVSVFGKYKLASEELKENQKDEDDLPAYKIVDTVLKDYVEEHRSSREIVDKRLLKKELVDDLVRRIHLAEYKRRQSPIGIRVSKKSFSKGRYFPIVQKWIKDRLEEEI